MIDFIPGFQFTDTEKQLYGSVSGAILGALIGAVAGAFSTYFIANRERNKQDELHKIQINRKHMSDSAVSIQSIELAVSDLLIKCEANNGYVKDIQKGQTTKDAGKLLALMQLSTPFEYPKLDISHTEKILNDRVVTLWANLCQEIELQNKNITDFNDYYKLLLGTVHSALLKGEKIDVSVVESDSKTIQIGMQQQLNANAQLREKCLRILAQIDCFKVFMGEVDIRDYKRLQEFRNRIQELISFEPSEEKYAAAFAEEDKMYDPAKMFKTESTGDKK